MAVDPYIARGVAPVDVTNTLAQVSALRQRDQSLQQDAQMNALYQQKFQAAQQQDEEDDAEWDAAYAARDWGTMARLDPQSTKIIYEHENPQPAQMGALYKTQDGTYQPADKAAGQKFYQEPERGYAPTEAPADQRLYQWYANLPPEQQQAFLNMKRSSATPEAAAAIASAKATGTEQAKAKVAAQGDLPRVEANASDMRGVLSQLKSHKGLRFILGGYSMAPAVPGTPQADALALWEQVQGKAFLEAFNSLKGGGQITEKEGEKATAAITRMSNRRQSLGGFMKAVKDLEEVVSAGEARARQKAGQGGSQRLRFDANGDPVQ
jgi:hypothetical protein